MVDVNQRTLTMFGATGKADLLANLDKVFRDEMRVHWEHELTDMWNGKLDSEYEGVNYSLSGAAVDILMRSIPMPGFEASWERVLVAISDITARKKAESYLSYLGTHDVLTALHNRSYFEDRCSQLQKEGRYPISVIAMDLNGLKRANDSGGHEAGDALIRRAAEVITKAAGTQDVAARTGGDEFALLLTYQDERAARNLVAQLQSLIELNNQFYSGTRLSLSVGTATAYTGLTLNEVLKKADQRMYEAKRAFYASSGDGLDRRLG